jgi:hypothetical protein
LAPRARRNLRKPGRTALLALTAGLAFENIIQQ